MKINIFDKYKADYKKLIKYGFKKEKDFYVIEKFLEDSNFKAIFKIYQDNKIDIKVMDLEAGDEYLPIRAQSQQGEFVGKVREDLNKLLEDIRCNCFYKDCFLFPQSNRITKLIFDEYCDKPEFLWEKYDDTGIFRNKSSNKWYGIIMNVDRSKIQHNKNGMVEVMNLKLSSSSLNSALAEDGFYPAYHMNKKYWISIILDDTVCDERIMGLVRESYNLVKSKKK